MASGSPHHSLLVIDQVPLLNDARDACEEACRRIGRLKAELHQHETHDVPAYERWFNSSFGRFLTEIRETSAEVRETELELVRVRQRHWARFFGSSSGVHSGTPLGSEGGFSGGDPEDEEDRAYRGASFVEEEVEDSSGAADEDEYGPGWEESRYWDDGTFDDEQEFHYSEDSESTRRFEDLFVRGHGRRSGGYRGRRWSEDSDFRSGGARRHPDGEAEEDLVAAGAARRREDPHSRLKERYRALVRLLHPDLNPALSAEQKSLWNQVQAAYREKNLEQLDLLIVLSDVWFGQVSRSTSLHQLRRAAQEIERSVGPLRRKLEEARQNRAWKFTELEDRAALKRAVEKEFQADLSRLRARLMQLRSQIARFSSQGRPAHAPVRWPRTEGRA